MNIKEAAEAFVAAHRPDCIDVESIEQNWTSVEDYLDFQAECSDPERPWMRYVEISQFDHVDGHSHLVEWEDQVSVLLPRQGSGLDLWFNADGELTDEQVENYKSRFYDRVRTLILEECPHADVDIAHPGNLTGMTFDGWVERIWDTVLEESHNWVINDRQTV